MKGLAIVAVLAACGGSAPPATPQRPAQRMQMIDPNGRVEFASEDVTFTAGGQPVPGTLLVPSRPGKYPALVIMAGSGPTDRNWSTPLLPGIKPSGRLLAEALAAHGVIVLRFDKASSGANKTALDNATIDIYVDELRAGLALLRARPEVDTSHVFLAGHSEGGLHAIRTALVEKQLAGLVLISTSGRSMKDLVVAQVDAQVHAAAPNEVDRIVGPFKQALDDFVAGKPVDPRTATPVPGLQKLLAAFVNPQTATLARAMIALDPVPLVAKVDVPVLVLQGGRDVQVDPELDAKPLANARQAAHQDVTLVIAPEADHLLKHETKSRVELTPALVETEYAADRPLDPGIVDPLVGWIARH